MSSFQGKSGYWLSAEKLYFYLKTEKNPTKTKIKKIETYLQMQSKQINNRERVCRGNNTELVTVKMAFTEQYEHGNNKHSCNTDKHILIL